MINYQNIAIITARKGSRRIKNKNLKNFFGKPVIYYSIENLKKTKLFDEIIVTTNCNKIAKTSLKYGVSKIIKRPRSLSNNSVGTLRVVKHSIKKLEKLNIFPKFICCVYPAAPLIRYQNINYAYKKIKRIQKGFVYPSTVIKEKAKNLKIVKRLVKPEKINVREGIINELFLDAGQFWFAKTTTWKKLKTAYTKNSYTFPIKEEFSDINSIGDWKKVIKIFKKNKKNYLS